MGQENLEGLWIQRDLALRRRLERVFHESGRTAERLLRLQRTDSENSLSRETDKRDVKEIRFRLSALEVTNSMPAQALLPP